MMMIWFSDQIKDKFSLYLLKKYKSTNWISIKLSINGKKKVGAPRSQGILKFQREIQIGLKAWIVIDVDKGEKMSRIVSWLLDGAENWATFCHQPPFYLPNPPLVKEQLEMGQFVFPKYKSLETKYKQDQVNCENISIWKILSLENIQPWKILTPENIHTKKYSPPEKFSP